MFYLDVRSCKKSSNQEIGLGNRGHLKALNDTKIGLQMSPIPQISFLVGNFFAASYSKTALDVLKHHKSKHCTYYVRTNHISHRDRIVCLSVCAECTQRPVPTMYQQK